MTKAHARGVGSQFHALREEEPAPQEVFGREEERVLAETLWSRLRSFIGESAFDL